MGVRGSAAFCLSSACWPLSWLRSSDGSFFSSSIARSTELQLLVGRPPLPLHVGRSPASSSVLRSLARSWPWSPCRRGRLSSSSTTPSMRGEDVLPHHGSSVPFDSQGELRRPNRQQQQSAAARAPAMLSVLGSVRACKHPAGLAQRPPHGHQEQVLMLQGVGQRSGTVQADHVRPLRQARRQPAVLDLLDDQAPRSAARARPASSDRLPRAAPDAAAAARPPSSNGPRRRTPARRLRPAAADRACRRCTRSPSPLATTAVASLPNSRTVFDRLSNRSWPLMASTLHFLPLRIATLTRSHSISRRPSLAIV